MWQPGRKRSTSSNPNPGQSWVGFNILAGATLAAAIMTVVVGVQEPPNKLAAALVQCMTLLFGVLTAHVYGKLSIEVAAKEIVGTHARKSIRRVVNLRNALDRHNEKHLQYLADLESAAGEDSSGRSYVEFNSVRWAIGALQQSTFELQATCEDTLEDWNDIAPLAPSSEAPTSKKIESEDHA